MTDTLITTVHQSDGTTREIHAQDAAHARRAQDILRRNPAMIDGLDGTDGIQIRTMDQLRRQPSKTRTITLTDRRPVTIREDEWPILAEAKDDSATQAQAGDYGRYQQALTQGEYERYHLLVRQHTDGRALVYGTLRASRFADSLPDWRGGELLETGADLAAAIRRVGESGRLPDSVIRECMADLPAEDL